MQASRQKDTDHSTRVSPSPTQELELKAGDRGFEERKTPRKRRRSPINMGRLLEKEETVTLWDGGHRSGGEEPERRGVREGP